MNLQEQFVQFYEQSGYTQPQLARAIGVSSASVNMYVNGKYEAHGGNLATIEKKVAAFLAREAAKKSEAKLDIRFVAIRTAARVAEVMRSAHLEGEVAVVYGQAGLGKTMALKQYCADNPDAVLIEADPSFTAQVLLRHIARAIGANPTGTMHKLFEAVVERLQDSGRLLVVDEAELLQLRALECLRRIHDKAGVGLVLAGMPKLLVNLRGKRGELVQLYSRVALALNLGETLPDNELEMLAAAALPDADADTLAALVASAQGNTRRLTKMMHGVVRTARLNNMAVNAEIVKKYSKMIIR